MCCFVCFVLFLSQAFFYLLKDFWAGHQGKRKCSLWFKSKVFRSADVMLYVISTQQNVNKEHKPRAERKFDFALCAHLYMICLYLDNSNDLFWKNNWLWNVNWAWLTWSVSTTNLIKTNLNSIRICFVKKKINIWVYYSSKSKK